MQLETYVTRGQHYPLMLIVTMFFVCLDKKVSLGKLFNIKPNLT